MSERAPASAAPAAAETVFGAELGRAEHFASLLAERGVTRGVIGPREVPRLWERHLLNCAVLAELVPHGVSVVDVGAGAGLPGIALALARPDLGVTLVESMLRRTDWLEHVVAELGLSVTVVRGRAEQGTVREALSPADVVTARAVAPLDKLAAWCLPLTAVGGEVLAIKGDSAEREVTAERAAVRRCGGGDPTVAECGRTVLQTPTRVVRFRRVDRRWEAGRGNRTRRIR